MEKLAAHYEQPDDWMKLHAGIDTLRSRSAGSGTCADDSQRVSIVPASPFFFCLPRRRGKGESWLSLVAVQKESAFAL